MEYNKDLEAFISQALLVWLFPNDVVVSPCSVPAYLSYSRTQVS